MKKIVLLLVLPFLFGFDFIALCISPNQTYYATVQAVGGTSNNGQFYDVSGGSWGANATANSATELGGTLKTSTYKVTVPNSKLQRNGRYIAVFRDGTASTSNVVGAVSYCYSCGSADTEKYGAKGGN